MADDILHNQTEIDSPVWSDAVDSVGGQFGAADTAAMSTLKSIGQIATDERRSAGPETHDLGGTGLEHAERVYMKFTKRWRRNTLDTICWFSLLMREARIVLYTFTVGENDPRAQLSRNRELANGYAPGNSNLPREPI